MNELTKEQTERQDFVDNEIYALVNNLIPENLRHSANTDEIPFSIEWISDIREKISETIAEHLDLQPGTPKCEAFEMDFYPYSDGTINE